MKKMEARNVGRLNNSKTRLGKKKVTDKYTESHKKVKNLSNRTKEDRYRADLISPKRQRKQLNKIKMKQMYMKANRKINGS